MFQSTPVIANGRIAGCGATPGNPVSFQSTPVIANGRIQLDALKHVTERDVSIHARYC